VELELESPDELEEGFSDVEADLSLSDDELEESEPLEEPFDDDDDEAEDELLAVSRLSLR
jgi:hypothetical protein